MSERIVVLCPGQGAQAVGMGRRWAEASPEAARVFALGDAVLGEAVDRPLSRLCWEGPEEVLNRTDVSQPALFVAGVASARALFGSGWIPAAAAGLSLGEYTALHLAGSISFEDGLRLVALRGRAMQEAARATPSGMVALIGAEEHQAREVCERAAGAEVLVAANFNAPGQVVLSGSSGACDRAVEAAGGMGLRASRLAVAGAFHSPLMAPAKERLAAALRETEVKAPACPVLSNVTGRPHDADPRSIRDRLGEQLTSPVRWSDCAAWLAERFAGLPFHETAPGKVLSGLMRRISRDTKVVSHDEPG
ncbi:MAG TPA: [acyl-carrier-protein] S-malonyltransferase [Phycisphaerales bacterium]|nr:[acyl-carrier-protein] S-malonyltransferase [Phycisphaerales bacterium]